MSGFPKEPIYALSRFCAVISAALVAILIIGGYGTPLHAALPAWENARDIVFRIIASDTGLPESSAPLSIAQDRAGFIWIATETGVGRWDGRTFKMFDADGRSGSLPERSVKVVAADDVGRLWAGLSSEGLFRFDSDTETFQRPANATALDRERVFAIANGRNRSLWVASDGGVARVDGRTFKVDAGIGRRLGLPVGAASSIVEDHWGRLHVILGGRLYQQDALGGRFRHVDLGGANAGTAAPVATTLFVDHADGIWVSTSSSGVILIDDLGNFVRRVQLRASAPGSVQPMAATAIEIRPGVLWIDTHEGIYEIDSRSWSVKRLHHEIDRASSLADDSVNALMIDRSGSVWIAAASTLSIAHPRPSIATGVQTILGRGASNRPYRAWAVAVASDGRLWLGAEDDPIRIFGTRREMVRYDIPGEKLRPRGVMSFAFTPDGQVYAASDTGLFRMNLDGRLLDKVSDAPARQLVLAGTELYVGGTDGLSRLDTRVPGARLTKAIDGARLTSPRVTALLTARDGALWIGTSRGLNRFEPATGRVTQFLPDTRNPQALSANYVNSLFTDRGGRLWVATSGGGIDILQSVAGRDARFRRLRRTDGLPNETVDAVLAGPDGYVWASTDDGVVRINPSGLAIKTFQEAEGLQSLAHWQGARAITEDGRLIFAGTSGLSVIDAATFGASTKVFPLVVTDLKIGSQTIPFSASHATEPIEVPSSAATFAAEFSALDFAAANRITYSYRLMGLEDNWTRADPTHRTARYTNLPPGDYTLQIRASGRDGSSHGGSLEIPVHVSAAWNQTLAFKAAIGLFVLVACWGVSQSRIHFAKRRERLLETVVEERTAALERSQDELQKLAYFDALTGLANRRMFTQNVERLLTPTERQAPAFALILVDLDKFKVINDTLGHDAGDALLIEAAERLVSSVRENDSVARLGGDEFAILLSGHIDATSLDILCGRVIGAVAAPILFAGQTIETSASLGVALFPDNGQTQDELYKAADLALYAAKRGGRNTWRLYSELLSEEISARTSDFLATARFRSRDARTDVA